MSMPVESLILIAVAIINFLFASIIIARNTFSRIHVLFSITMLFNVLWALGVAIMIGAGSLETGLSWSRLFVVAPMFTAYFSIHLTHAFPTGKKTPLRYTFLFAVPLVVLATVYVLDGSYLIEDFFKGDSLNEFTVNKLPYTVYSLFFVIYFSISYLVLFFKARKARGIYRTQIGYVLAGIFLSSSLALLTNLLLPYLGNSRFVWLGPVFTLIYVATFTYAIVRHRLFDIKLIIARSLSYTMVLGVVFATFALLIFALSNAFYHGINLTTSQQVLYSLIAVLLASAFQPLKRFFDHATNRLFLHDTYVTQEVLDKLSSVLVVEINLTKMVNKSMRLLVGALRPNHIRFVVFKDGERYEDITVGKPPALDLDRKWLAKFEGTLIIKDELVSSLLKTKLEQHDTQIVLKLRTNEDVVGAILLGPKLNGVAYSTQDIELLSIAEKELAVAIQNSRNFEQIQEFNIKLQREVEKATSELRASNKRLKELDEAKDEFVSMASHQLRTPLTAVKGYLSMVLEGDVGKLKKDQTNMLQEAFASSQRMVYLIADLLNVSRLKTGKFMIAQSKISLADIVEQEVEQLKPTARSRRLKLLFDKPARFPLVMLDETKTRQVIMNFIDNAIYYTKPGGTIDVRLTAKKDSLEYAVKDTGIGVPKADQPQLFTKFFRASNARKARPDGTGLGLYMAQKVISAQGGNIIFDSVAGKGSTFGFSFPRNKIEVKKPTRKKSTKR